MAQNPSINKSQDDSNELIDVFLKVHPIKEYTDLLPKKEVKFKTLPRKGEYIEYSYCVNEGGEEVEKVYMFEVIAAIHTTTSSDTTYDFVDLHLVEVDSCTELVRKIGESAKPSL